MFEHHSEPLIPRHIFIRRVGRYALIALVLVSVSWLIGILGYRVLESMSWIDAILNSAMLLGGMGPVDRLQTDGGKLFASFYAMFSGIVFLVSVGLLVAPILHRVMHKFHIDEGKDDDDDDDGDQDDDEKPTVDENNKRRQAMRLGRE